MEKRKPVMLSESVYSRLEGLAAMMSKETGKKLTFSEAIKQLILRDLRFLQLDPEVKKYIYLFVSKLSLNPDILGVLLFGSVAKGNFSKYSDIDVMIIVNGKFLEAFSAVNKVIASIKGEKKTMLEDRGLYLRINPLILTQRSLDRLEPIYFDLVDYGIPLFERNLALTEFFNKIRRIKYFRRFTASGEILEWKA